MAKISQITSDGGDPNKKAQEEENQNKKPKQQQVQNLRIPEDLPEEINELILTLLKRCEYPSLLCISKAFRQIITSPRLFETRSRLGRTEQVLYTFIGFPDFPKWFILHRRNNSLRLSKINSLPPMLPGSAIVTIEHDMYIIGGCLDRPVSTVIVIDCRFHTWRHLPSMKRTRYHAAAGVVNGNIYIIGGCIKRGGDWIEVFDVKNQIWETVTDPNPNTYTASMDGIFLAYVVMEDKIYIFDRTVTGGCLTYEPRQRKWEYWGILNPLWRFWHVSSCCVVDDMLYSIDIMCYFGYPIVLYDPRDMVWRPVKGVGRSDLLNLVYHESKMVNLGGKLVVLGSNYPSWCILERDIWCQVISLERREDGEIWGNVESKSRVLSSFKSPLVELCRTVTV